MMVSTRGTLRKRLTLLGAALLLYSCAWLGIYPAMPVVLPQQGDMINQRITHRIEWQDGDSTETFLAIMDTHAGNVQLVAVMPTGISLFSLNRAQDIHELETSALASGNINPDTLLAMLQLANYRAEDISAGLANPWSITASQQLRTLQYHGKTVLTVEFASQPDMPVTINNRQTGQRVTVTRLGVEAIP